jgi:predicted ATPase
MVSVLIGHRLAGTCRYLLGEFASARAHLEQALTLDDPEHHRSLGFVYAVDPRVAALDWLHRLLFFIGHPDQAQVRCREGLAEARDIAHAHSLAYALHGASQFHQIRRDRSSVEHSSGELLSLCAAQGFPYHQAAGLMLRGWAFVEAGQLETGLAQIHRGLGEYRATRTAYQLPYYLGLLADAYRRAGRVSDGFSVTDEAAKRVQRTDERWYEAELHRLRGGLLLSVGTSEINEAEACFQRALSVAREQSARMFELRAARDLAECWAEQGERQRARDLLAPVYAWFTEGFDTADLKEAKALLDQLA